MTGKLIQYEFRSIVKMMGIVWVALPAMAVIMSLFQFLFDDGWAENHFLVNTLSAIVSFMYFAIFVALIVVTVLIIITRFYRGLMRDEGYLMHTLPVKTWQLITAKGIVAVCVELISMIVAIISIIILGLESGSLGNAWEFIAGMCREFAEHPAFIGLTLEVLVLIVAVCAAGNYRVYAAMSIGQLASKHRIALSVAAYLGIGVALMLILSILNAIMNLDLFGGIFDAVGGWIRGMEPTGMASAFLLMAIASQAVLIAIYHVISEQILRKRLNLE